MKRTMNFYVAWTPEYKGCRTAMYSGCAMSEQRFAELCEQEGYDLEGLEVELEKENPKDELGRLYSEGVRKDLGTI